MSNTWKAIIIIFVVFAAVVVSAFLFLDYSQPKTLTSINKQFIVVDNQEKQAVFYKVDENLQKTKLFQVVKGYKKQGISGDLSSDKTKIIYNDGDADLRIYNLKTGKDQLILKSTPYDEKTNSVGDTQAFSQASFSPDMKKILYGWTGWEWSSDGIADSDGKNKANISPNREIAEALGFYKFDWSNNSKHFVLSGVNNDFGGDNASLYIAETNNPNNGKQLLPKNEKAEYPNILKDTYSPQFSPDDKKIAFSYRYKDIPKEDQEGILENYREIYSVNTDGTEFNAITNNQSYSMNPLWLNDHEIIYGISNFYTPGKKGIYKIDTKSKNNTEVMSDILSSYFPVSLSKDNNYLIYYAGDLEEAYDSPNDLYILNLNDKSKTNIQKDGQEDILGFVGWF